MNYLDKNKFWQWAYSDFRSNAARGVLAEYIVGTALNCLSGNRKEWDAFDLMSNGGAKIEVKSSGYLQSWTKNNKLSDIRFDVSEKLSWNESNNTYSTEANRPADIYVFCILEEKNISKVDPLDIKQWSFIVFAKNDIQEKLGKQKSVSLTTLERIGGKRVQYSMIASEVQRIWDITSPSGGQAKTAQH